MQASKAAPGGWFLCRKEPAENQLKTCKQPLYDPEFGQEPSCGKLNAVEKWLQIFMAGSHKEKRGRRRVGGVAPAKTEPA